MFFTNFVELVSFSIIFHDAHKRKARLISAQTVAGLSLAASLTLLNLPRKNHVTRDVKIFLTILTTFAGFAATWKVAQTSGVSGEDDVDVRPLPRWMSKLIIYVLSIVFGLVSLLVACDFDLPTFLRFLSSEDAVCTLQNYLHAFALIPQLQLCRRQGFVCPTAGRFLFIIGINRIYEFVSDASVSYMHYVHGKFHLREISFMTGDFVAAVILLEFLYLAMKQRSLRVLFASESESLFETTKCQVYDARTILKDAELLSLTPVLMGPAATVSSEMVMTQRSFPESVSELVSRLADFYARNSQAVAVFASVASMVLFVTGIALGAIDGRSLAFAGIIVGVVRYMVNLFRQVIPAASSAKQKNPILV
eukprot:TRINITY_DN28710_c0_g1_i1.p1 TRINITY_DN28710_c0_g1~~TRINITY_DN28710_c0_g1_i1.p1  ORF type:complete len:386 (+),score=44.47 TRINITY_DN28710_c0_g1_i1:66-1160(+)